MWVWGFLVKLFSRTAGAAVAGPVKAVTGAVKDLSDSAKDVAGIRKDLVETELAKKHLADEESLIVKPEPGDVEKYDPRLRKILRAAENEKRRERYFQPVFPFRGCAVALAYILFNIVLFAVLEFLDYYYHFDPVGFILRHVRALLGK